jgi:glycosyltransferase involved in cell wall biosynthesis
MKTIIHITADFPDPIQPVKTKAVSNLLAVSPGFRHVVYSLNRADWRQPLSLTPFAPDRIAIAYGAPPYGLALRRFLAPVTAAIAQDIAQRGITADLIHAHKFSIEGLIAADIARQAGRPFICNLWGDTDIKIFQHKPELRRRYRRTAAAARLMLPAAPWTARYFTRALNVSPERLPVLPIITASDALIAPVSSSAPRLVSVFHLDSWKRKGLDILARAVAEAARDIPGLRLDVFGSGQEASLRAATDVVRKAHALDCVRFKGAAPHEQIQQLMNGYTAFVMAPRRETYGMVHVEAALAGLPILWSKDRGIDGLFPEGEVGYRADPNSVDDVARGIRLLVTRERAIKKRIAHLQQRDAFAHLRTPGIAAQYSELLQKLAA